MRCSLRETRFPIRTLRFSRTVTALSAAFCFLRFSARRWGASFLPPARPRLCGPLAGGWLCAGCCASTIETSDALTFASGGADFVAPASAAVRSPPPDISMGEGPDLFFFLFTIAESGKESYFEEGGISPQPAHCRAGQTELCTTSKSRSLSGGPDRDKHNFQVSL